MSKTVSKWGRTLGLIIGLLLFPKLNFFGLILCYWIGSFFDRALNSLTGNTNTQYSNRNNTIDPVLLQHMFSLAGFVAKSDGKVSSSEIEAASEFMRSLKLSKQETQQAIHYFNQGKSTHFHLEHCIQQLRLYTLFHQQAKHIILSLIKLIGEADQPIPPAKNKLIRNIFATFSRSVFHGERFSYHGWQHQSYQEHHTTRSSHNLQWAYQTLGVSSTDDLGTITKKYRKLLSQHHPDRLQAQKKQLSSKEIQQANNKTHEIKKAYDLIKQQTSH